jgi:hypothetical protein
MTRRNLDDHHGRCQRNDPPDAPLVARLICTEEDVIVFKRHRVCHVRSSMCGGLV